MGNTNFKFSPPAQKPLDWSLTKLVKSITSVTLGCIIGVIPAIIAISAISIITIFRWPINIYFSLKFVALTPILKPDLRILIFFFFPILHSILPVLFFTFSCFAAVVYSISATTIAIHKRFELKYFSWADSLELFGDSTKRYYRLHVDFVGKCESLVGKLPPEWENMTYGLDLCGFDFAGMTVEKLFLSIILQIYGILVIPAGVVLILALKLPLVYFYVSYSYFKCVNSILDTSRIIAFSPFILLVYVFGVSSAVLGFSCSPWIAMVASLRCSWVGVRAGGDFQKGKIEAWNILKKLDKTTADMTFQNLEFLSHEVVEYKSVDSIIKNSK